MTPSESAKDFEKAREKAEDWMENETDRPPTGRSLLQLPDDLNIVFIKTMSFFLKGRSHSVQGQEQGRDFL